MRKIFFSLLFVIIVLLYILPLGSYSLLDPDEARYAELAREMMESGDYVTPRLNGVKYFEKPALLYWANAMSFKMFGLNEFAARFATCLCALLGIAVTGAFGAAVYGAGAGAAAAAVTATSLLYFAIGTLNTTDMMLSFFITAALASFYIGLTHRDRRWYMLMYASMALGLLTKGLVGVVLPCAVIFWYMIFSRRWYIIIDALYLPGLLLFALISTPWFYMVCQANPDFFRFFFIQEHFLRYTTRMHDRYEPFWFFLPLIPAALVPWTGFLPSLFSRDSVLRSPENRASADANKFITTWFAVILLFYSFSSSKLIPYIVPCVVPLALFIGAELERMISDRHWHGHALIWQLLIAMLLSAGFVTYAFIGREVQPRDIAFMAAAMSIALLTGPLCAMFFTRRKYGSFTAAVCALCVSAMLFTASAQTVYEIIDDTRSLKGTTDIVISEKNDDDVVAVYGEVLHGVTFYTRGRVLLVGAMGELEYGIKQPDGEGTYMATDDFKSQWFIKRRPFALIVRSDRMGDLFPDGNTGAARSIDAGKYTVLFNAPRKAQHITTK